MSVSKTKTNSTSIINETEIKQMNKSMNKYISNVLIKNQQECSAMTVAENEFSIGNVNSSGEFKFEKSSTQDATTALQCYKAEAISKDLQSFVYENVLEKIETSKSKDVWEMVDKTIEKSGNSKASQESINIMKRNKQVNTTHKNVQNYVANVIEKNLNIDNVSKCVNTVRQKQIMELGDLEAGDNIEVTGIVQKQQINSTTNCIMELDVIGTLFEDFENMAGNNLKKNPNKISTNSASSSERNEVQRMKNEKKKSESSEESESDESESSMSSGFMKYIYYIIAVVVVLIIIAGGYYFYKSRKNASDPTYDQNTITSMDTQTSVTQTSVTPQTTTMSPTQTSSPTTSVTPSVTSTSITPTSITPTTSYSSHTSVHYIPFPVECPPIEIPILMPLPLPFPMSIKSQRY
jgi:hypothetical protein